MILFILNITNYETKTLVSRNSRRQSICKLQTSTRNAIVTIEDAQALDENGNAVSMPGKVGFYQDTVNGVSSAYLMESRTITLKDGNGLPFQISSSYSGPLPITIRMKVVVDFD